MQTCDRCCRPITFAEQLGLCATCHLAALTVASLAVPSGTTQPTIWGQGAGQAEQALLVELNVPQDATFTCIAHAGRIFGDGWQDYSWVGFGIVVPEVPPHATWPFWQAARANGQGAYFVQLWRHRLYCAEVEAFLEANWSPEQGKRVQLLGLERVSRLGDANRVLRGLKLLRLIEQRGRPAGSRDVPREQFVTDYPRAYAEEHDRMGERPSQHEVAAAMGLPRSTFTRYLKEYHLPWPPPA